MSGSNSSAPSLPAATPAEPLSFAVHSLPTPDVAAERRTSSGRLKMLLVWLVCAAPVVASYFMYYVVRPDGRSNYGVLIDPQRPMPAAAELPLTDLQGQAVDPASLRRQWLLVVVAGGACDALCEKQLYTQHQLREMLGKERDRLDRVWLVDDDVPVRPDLRPAVGQARVLRVPAQALASWLEPEAGRPLGAHFYLVDPQGNWMMRFPADAEPKKVKRDIERLLRASASWDEAGR